MGALVPAAVAAVSDRVGMIPQGLVLLASMAFAIGVIRLGRRTVLVQELAAVETLARVDVFCIDKTGALTSGRISRARKEPIGSDAPTQDVASSLVRAFAGAHGQVLEAVACELADLGWQAHNLVPFSLLRRWSAVGFE